MAADAVLIVETPDTRGSEREHVLDVLLSRFLGLSWHRVPTARNDVRITVRGMNGELCMPDILMSMSDNDWLDERSLPALPLEQWDPSELGIDTSAIEGQLPIFYGSTRTCTKFDSGRVWLPIDIFGTVFFMLSRYEEVVVSDRDKHDRFPATASIAYKGGFLDRPIIDEYTEILWTALKRVWPGLERKSRQAGVRVTCDVDQPFDCRVRDYRRWVGRMGGDLLVRRNMSMAFDRLRNRFAVRRGDFRYDPYYTFDWYLETCERAGRQATFYFLAGHTSPERDSCYDIDEPVIIDLIQRIARRGHNLGMHGSYNTFRDADQMRRERQRMIKACRQAGVDDDISGNRQHYLRWDARQTPDHLEAAGFSYDTSGGFADRPGYRFGTARPFPMWSWRLNAPLRIIQRPLALMECSVLDDRYLGMGKTREAMDLMLHLKQRAMAYGGDFTLLWHNSWLTTAEDRACFRELIT